MSAHFIFIYVRTHLDCRPAFSSRRHSKHWINSRRLQQKFKYFSFANENYEDPQSLKCVYTIKQVPTILCTSFNTVNIHSKVEKRFSSARIDILLLTKQTHELNWDASIRQWSRQSKQIPSQETFWGTSRPYLCYQKYKIIYHQSIIRSIVYIKKYSNQICFILVYYLCWFWSFFVLSRNSLRLLLILIKEWRIETKAAKLMKRATPIGRKNHNPLANLSVNLRFVSNVKGCNGG